MFHNKRGTRLDFLPLFASNEKYAQNLKLKNNKLGKNAYEETSN
jgi:hypothetical protein